MIHFINVVKLNGKQTIYEAAAIYIADIKFILNSDIYVKK